MAQQAPIPSLKVVTVANADAQLFNSYPAILKGKTDIDIRPQVSGFMGAYEVGVKLHPKVTGKLKVKVIEG